MNDIFMRLHPDYQELTDDEKKELLLEKKFIEENYMQLLSICNDYEKKFHVSISDRHLSYIVRGTWATVLHRSLHPDYEKVANDDFSALKNERSIIETYLSDIIKLWNKNISNGIVDIDEALRLGVNEVWTDDIFYKLHPELVDNDIQDELRYVMEKKFISENIYNLIRLYNEYMFVSADSGVPKEKLRAALHKLWGESITGHLYSNISSLTPHQYMMYLNESVFIEGHIPEIMQAYQDCELVMPSHSVRLRNAVDVVRTNSILFKLYPNYESMSDDEQLVVLVERQFIGESLGDILSKYVQFRCTQDDDADKLFRKAVDDVWTKSIFSELYPNYEMLSDVEKRQADNDRISLQESLPNVKKQIALYGFKENEKVISK